MGFMHTKANNKTTVDVCYRKSNKITIVREKYFICFSFGMETHVRQKKRKVLKVVRGKWELKGVGVGASCG